MNGRQAALSIATTCHPLVAAKAQALLMPARGLFVGGRGAPAAHYGDRAAP
jgi:hypothetical protein